MGWPSAKEDNDEASEQGVLDPHYPPGSFAGLAQSKDAVRQKRAERAIANAERHRATMDREAVALVAENKRLRSEVKSLRGQLAIALIPADQRLALAVSELRRAISKGFRVLKVAELKLGLLNPVENLAAHSRRGEALPKNSKRRQAKQSKKRSATHAR